MGVSGFFGKRNIGALTVSVEAPEEAYAGSPIPLKVTVENGRRFLHAFLLSVRVGDDVVLFPFVDARGRAVKYIEITVAQRGLHSLPRVHVCSVFPFGFFVRCREVLSGGDFIVLPRPKKCALPEESGTPRKMRGEKGSAAAGYEGEVISFRCYAEGDPLKYIYWKASAKTGELKTKELTSLSHRQLLIDFDRISLGDREEKISCVTYLILSSSRRNIPVGLKIGGKEFRAGMGGAHRVKMLRELALYGKE